MGCVKYNAVSSAVKGEGQAFLESSSVLSKGHQR